MMNMMNNLSKNRKDLAFRTKEDNLSESLSDDDFELLTIKLKKLTKQESKNKNKLKKTKQLAMNVIGRGTSKANVHK